MTYLETIETVLEGIAEDMIKDQSSKGMRASGKSAESFEIKMSESGGDLYGAAHWYWQINGRRPGPFKDGIEKMLDWIKRKGITPRDKNTTLRQLAFLFARKITERGNDIYLKKRPGIAFKEIVHRWKGIAKQRLGLSLKEYIKQKVHGTSTKRKT